jgi:hypothetical protein
MKTTCEEDSIAGFSSSENRNDILNLESGFCFLESGSRAKAAPNRHQVRVWEGGGRVHSPHRRGAHPGFESLLARIQLRGTACGGPRTQEHRQGQPLCLSSASLVHFVKRASRHLTHVMFAVTATANFSGERCSSVTSE